MRDPEDTESKRKKKEPKNALWPFSHPLSCMEHIQYKFAFKKYDFPSISSKATHQKNYVAFISY